MCFKFFSKILVYNINNYSFIKYPKNINTLLKKEIHIDILKLQQFVNVEVIKISFQSQNVKYV